MKTSLGLVVIAGLAGACGPSATTPATVSGTAPPQAPAIAAEPCPSGEALNEAARRAWGKGAGTVTADCVALVAAGETLWFFDGTFEPGGPDAMSIGMWSALATPGGEVRWAEGEDDLPVGAMMRTYNVDWKAADLDGDGTDEVLHVAGYDHGGYMNSSLVIASIVGGQLTIASEGLPLSADNSAADPDPSELESCDGSWELVGRQVAVTYDGPSCERPGRHVFSWNGTALVEQAP